MRYRTLGSTGLKVSVIGIGTWQFGGEWGHDYTQKEVDAVLDTATDSGINLIDTAECYGDHTSEKFIGSYLKRNDRSRWVIATKFGHRFCGFMKRREEFSPKSVRKQLDESLGALGIDTIDVYQFHSGDDSLFLQEDLWAMLDEERRAGKIRHLGISIPSKGSELQAREAIRFGAEMLQVYYNRLDRRPEKDYFPHAERNNLGILARVPLASGLLSGKYGPGAQFPENDVRSMSERGKLEADLAEVARIHREELPAKVPMAQWALAWCLRLPVVTSVIPGCKDPDQVRANAAAADLLPG